MRLTSFQMSAKVQLSYSPIDSVAIKKVLDRYEGQSHENITADFEKRLAEFTNAKCAVALSSGTAAIHLSLKAIGVEPGDEVLVSTFTYVATINPILYLGARPIFIDVDQSSWNMDPELLEIAIKDRLFRGVKPKAILVVHTYGMPAQMKEIVAIAGQYEIPIVEDAAEALGSKIDGRFVGTFGKVGILSFNNNKILTTYGGGAVLTDDVDLASKISFWSGQSRESKMYYEHKELGYNYRMGPVNAAIGLSKVDNLEKEIGQRRIVFEEYKRHLPESKFLFQVEPPEFFSNRWLSAVTFTDQKNMDNIVQKIDNQGIETRRVWNPMNRQPLFSSFDYFTKTNAADSLFSKSLCLPFCEGAVEAVASVIVESTGYN